MKKIGWLLGFFVISILFVAPLEARDMKEMGMGMTEGKEGDGKGMMSGQMMGMHMMKIMMEKSVVATSDGGIVIVAVNKITKYDKNLNVINEAEIKMDMEAMEKNMKEMMEKCPMMKGEMKNMGSEMKETGKNSNDTAASSTGHEEHH